MKNKSLILSTLFFIASAFIMTACNKSSSADTTSSVAKQELSLYLTDAPGLFDQVLIDIRSVKVLVDTSADTRKHDSTNWDRMGANDLKKDTSFVWETLNIKPGVYDILKLRNGADTLLAATGITKGAIRLIKFEIGTNNSLVKDSVTYPVTLPTNALNYILIKLEGHECEEFLPGKTRLWLDFDVSRSIVSDGNHFILRPVFHFFTVNNSSAIYGKITPAASYPVVTIYNGTDTSYALPDKQGYFKSRGLKDGTYNVYINASNGYFDSTITKVVVKAPNETSVGVINLRK